jgi:hypothetical protein
MQKNIKAISKRRKIRAICTVFDLLLILSIIALLFTLLYVAIGATVGAAMIGSYGLTGLAVWSFFRNILNF